MQQCDVGCTKSRDNCAHGRISISVVIIQYTKDSRVSSSSVHSDLPCNKVEPLRRTGMSGENSERCSRRGRSSAAKQRALIKTVLIARCFLYPHTAGT